MTLTQTIYISLALVFTVIGLHQTITVGFGPSYWIFMTSIVFLMLFRYNRAKHNSQAGQEPVHKSSNGPQKVPQKKRK